MLNLEKIFVSLIAREALGKSVDDKAIRDTLVQDIKRVELLYELSEMHDMAHIVCLALKNIGVWGTEEVYKRFQRQQTLAVYRCEQQQHEYQRIKNAFETAKICYMPLKGVRIRPLYPEVWMRTSSDVDILLKEKDKTEAEELLMNNLGYTLKSRFKGETTLYNKDGFCVELHHVFGMSRIEEYSSDVWEKVKTADETHQVLMDDDMFFCHIVSHTVKHIVGNGCGIKPFIDIYLLEQKLALDFDKINAMLQKKNLLKAYNTLHKTVQVWFDGAESDKVIDILRKHVLMGGAYGNRVTGTNMRHRHSGGNFKYVLSLFLPGREEMERRYPVLKEHPNKLPLYHFKRWGHLIFRGRIRSSVEIVGNHMAVPKDDVKELDFMVKEMGLG